MEQLDEASDLQDRFLDSTIFFNDTEHLGNNNSHNEPYFLASSAQCIFVWLHDVLLKMAPNFMEVVDNSHIFLGGDLHVDILDDFLDILVDLLLFGVIGVRCIHLVNKISTCRQSAGQPYFGKIIRHPFLLLLSNYTIQNRESFQIQGICQNYPVELAKCRLQQAYQQYNNTHDLFIGIEYIKMILNQADETKLNEESILIIFLIVAVMSLFSISMLIIMIRRSLSLRKFKVYRIFVIIAFYIVTKLSTCTIMLIWIITGISTKWEKLTAQSVQLIFKDSLIFSDLSLVQLFLVTFQYYFVLCLNPFPHFKPVIPKFVTGMKIVQFLYFITTAVFLLLLNIGTLNFEIINIVAVSMNSLLIFCFIVSFFYLTFLMSGVMLSVRRKNRMNNVYKFLLLLLFTRFISSTVEWLIHFLIKNGDFSGFIILIKQKQGSFIIQAGIFIIYIVFILLSQWLPMMYCIKSSTMQLFMHDKNPDSLLTDDITTENMNNDDRNSLDPFNTSILQTGNAQITDLSSFINIQPLPIQSTIWGYYKGVYGSKVYFVRKSNQKISNYLIEDAVKQITQYRQKNIRQLNPMGYFIQQDFFFIFEPYRVQNLDMYISTHQSKEQILGVMNSIAVAISLIHEGGVVHGCLCPSNIFVIPPTDLSPQRIVFSGYGLNSFKRYLSMTIDYSNKTAYSAVQHLSNRNSVIIKPKKQADSYSYGMILYEMLTKNKGYRQLSIKQLQKKMCEQNTRPKIPDDIQPQLKNLIRKCWSKQPNLRPSMAEIVFQLKQLAKQK